VDELETRTAMFRALGDATRLRIFEYLRSCCGPVAVEESGDVRRVDGATVGEVCCRITGGERVTSTISHHVKELRLAGLVETERRGKQIICRINRDAVAALAAYLARETKGDGDDGCCD
jgi:ArsR family transcriptional regulator